MGVCSSSTAPPVAAVPTNEEDVKTGHAVLREAFTAVPSAAEPADGASTVAAAAAPAAAPAAASPAPAAATLGQ